MKKDGYVILNVEVAKETWKKLKIIGIQKEINMPDVIREILDKAVSKKQVEEIGV